MSTALAAALLAAAVLSALRSLRLHSRGCHIHCYEYGAYLLFLLTLALVAR